MFSRKATVRCTYLPLCELFSHQVKKLLLYQRSASSLSSSSLSSESSLTSSLPNFIIAPRNIIVISFGILNSAGSIIYQANSPMAVKLGGLWSQGQGGVFNKVMCKIISNKYSPFGAMFCHLQKEETYLIFYQSFRIFP